MEEGAPGGRVDGVDARGEVAAVLMQRGVDVAVQPQAQRRHQLRKLALRARPPDLEDARAGPAEEDVGEARAVAAEDVRYGLEDCNNLGKWGVLPILKADQLARKQVHERGEHICLV